MNYHNLYGPYLIMGDKVYFKDMHSAFDMKKDAQSIRNHVSVQIADLESRIKKWASLLEILNTIDDEAAKKWDVGYSPCEGVWVCSDAAWSFLQAEARAVLEAEPEPADEAAKRWQMGYSPRKGIWACPCAAWSFLQSKAREDDEKSRRDSGDSNPQEG